MENVTRIMIVDDHQLVIEGIKNLVSSEDIIIAKEFNDASLAWEAVKSKPSAFDLIITDISMPGLNGIEFCRRIKDEFPHIRVLMLSMYDSPAMVKESIAAEADGYILKNSGKNEFREAIYRVMNDGTYYSSQLMPTILKIAKGEKPVARFGNLTTRELEILNLIVNEMTSDEIADKLSISKKTVDNHRTHLLEKTGSKSTVGLVKFALLNNLN